MGQVIIFGGTSEGRELAEFAAENRLPVLVSVVSEYGESLLPESDVVEVRHGALDREAMRAFLLEHEPVQVFDATHPFARVVTDQIRELCRELSIPCCRVLRAKPEENHQAAARQKPGTGQPPVFWVDSVQEAAGILRSDSRPVLLTIGTRELEVFVEESIAPERIYARILPDRSGLEVCECLGIRGVHIIAMQGPFSQLMNEALLKQTGAGWLVTKESGTRGGFAQKLTAAKACGVSVVVIRRPGEREGTNLAAAKQMLAGAYGCKATAVGAGPGGKRQLYLIGMGMGGGRQLTLESLEALQRCDAVLGAPRMLQDMAQWISEKPQSPVYLAEDVAAWLCKTQNQCVAVVYSGDTGFYSGSRSLLMHMKEPGMKDWEVTVYPGISTVAALCARFHCSWEKLYLASVHGRACDVAGLLEEKKQVFLLLGGNQTLPELCRRLTRGGLGQTRVQAGIRIGYQDERLAAGTAQSLQEEPEETLTAVILRLEEPETGNQSKKPEPEARKETADEG